MEMIPEYYNHDDSDNVCYLCGNPEYKLVHDVIHYDFPLTFMQCQCGLVKQTPMPNERFFEWFFNSNLFFSSKESKKPEVWRYYDYFKDEPSRLATSKRRYKKLRHLFEVRRPLEIMKIGPATGTFLHVAREHGHCVRGCDVSQKFAKYARKHYHVTIDNGRYEQINYQNKQFDAILLLNVIENVPNQVEFLQAIYRTLKAGGYFILNFVDMEKNIFAAFQKSKYFLYRPPVCYIYTMPVMEKVLNKFGFKIAECHRDIRYLSIEKIATLLGWKWLLTIARSMKIHRFFFPLYAYPSRIVVARKNE